MRTSEKTELTIIIIYFIILLLGFIGWIKCLIKLIQCDFDPIGKAEIIYGIGTFTPFGAIIGWCDFGT